VTGQPRANAPRVTVFGPHPLLTVTIEPLGARGDDIHLHAGGQGVWVARMAAELGALPVLCGFAGGETGVVVESLLARMPAERRLVGTGSPSGAYVMDDRNGGRSLVGQYLSDPPTRHELDDLLATTRTALLDSAVLVICNPYPGDTLPLTVFSDLVSEARGNGIPVLVDLSSPRLESALEGSPDLVKLNDWELAEFVQGPVSAPAELRDRITLRHL
jgi:1-phosphofructokinase